MSTVAAGVFCMLMGVAVGLCAAVAAYFIGHRRGVRRGFATGLVTGAEETANQLVPVIHALGGTLEDVQRARRAGEMVN